MIKLKREFATHILKHAPARTDAALRDQFGISYNTFRKIECGQPIRSTLAARLQAKVKSELSS